MAKLNLNKPLLNETGEQVMQGTTLGKALGAVMLKAELTSEVDILKFFTWALELGKTGILELDEVDTKTLKTFVVEAPRLFVIAKGPILQAISKLKF